MRQKRSLAFEISMLTPFVALQVDVTNTNNVTAEQARLLI